MSAPEPQDVPDLPEPDPELWFIDESITDAPLAAHEDARFDKAARTPWLTRARLWGLAAAALLLHAALIAGFLYRDAHQSMQVAQLQETPVEIVQEAPPEPEKPPPPPPPPEQPKPPPPPEQKPPPPKEDLSPALSAPRAPNEDQVKTEKKEAKTAAPTKMETPTQGQPKAAPEAAAPPKEAPPTPPQKEEAAKEEDKSKPDAEALDKAKKAAKAKETKTKAARAQPRRKQVPNALAMLSGAPSLDSNMSFARPTPKTKIYGGTEDVRWMSQVEAMLEAKVTKLPRTAHWRDGGHVLIFFHVDTDGRVTAHDIVVKSGYPDIDQIAMRALASAAPFPPPPPGLERGLYWASTFDGVVPDLHISKK